MELNITIDKDVDVTITKIYQMYTYDGLIEGVADEYINEDLLIDIKQRAERVFYNNAIYTVDPRKFKSETFPPYTIIMELKSNKTYKNLDKDFSTLIVIVFQDQWCFPLVEHNIVKIKTIPFKKLCKEMQY